MNKNVKCYKRMTKYVNKDKLYTIKDRLRFEGAITENSGKMRDIVFTGEQIGRWNTSGGITEKFILRFPIDNASDILLIKECTKDELVKNSSVTITKDEALRIMEKSTKWMCSNENELIRELGVKMTTDRINPKSIVDYDREKLLIAPKIFITADSSIAYADYEITEAFTEQNGIDNALDETACLVQLNYERLIPENILGIIGMKV